MQQSASSSKYRQNWKAYSSIDSLASSGRKSAKCDSRVDFVGSIPARIVGDTLLTVHLAHHVEQAQQFSF